jgi:hypothetical protein
MTAAVAEFVPVRRCHKGVEVIEEILVELDGDRLTIRSEWSDRRQDFKRVCEYRVEKDESPMGRAFHLHRDAESIAKDPDHEPSYWVLIANDPKDTTCTCKGSAATDRYGRCCKHTAALEWAVSEKLL